MNYYLTPWTLDNDPDDPTWGIPGAVAWVDLRPPLGPPVGFAWAAFPARPPDPNAIDLGDSLGGLRNKSAAETALGLGVDEIVATNVLDLVWEVLNQHADPTGATRWKPLVPTSRRVMELHLGGLLRTERFHPAQHPLVVQVERENYRNIRQETLERAARGIQNRDPRFYLQYLQRLTEKYGLPFTDFIPPGLPVEQPEPHGSEFTDNFNGDDSDTMGVQLTWTELAADMDIASNKAVGGSSSGATARADHDVSSDDHTVEAKLETSLTSSNREGSVIARKDSSATMTFYAAQTRFSNDLLQHRKRVSGSSSHLSGSPISFTFSVDTQYLTEEDSDGSTHKFILDRVTKNTATDTAITGNTRGGLRLRFSDTKADDWKISDNAAATAKRRRVGTGAGWSTRR